MSIDWNEELAEQLDWHWRSKLRRRLDDLTDEIALLRDLFRRQPGLA
jgi:hypothetical protein